MGGFWQFTRTGEDLNYIAEHSGTWPASAEDAQQLLIQHVSRPGVGVDDSEWHLALAAAAAANPGHIYPDPWADTDSEEEQDEDNDGSMKKTVETLEHYCPGCM